MVSIHAAILAMALSGAGQTVLLDFYSDGCAPCREMNPTVQALIAAGYPVQQINTTQNPKLALKYGVKMVPCFVMVVNGREVDRCVGKQSRSRLEQMCRAGSPAGAASRAPMLAMNSAPPTPQPIPPSLSLPSTSSSTMPASMAPFAAAQPPAAPSNEPWNPSIPAQPIAALPLKAPSGVSDATLLAASVRLRVEDPDGRSCGSGTIVDCRGNEALVLTCGHIFRDSQGKGRIEVDLFGPNGVQQVPGQLMWPPSNAASFTTNSPDIALVAIRVSGPVAAARIAPPGYRVASGMPVITVGCNNGDTPTVQHSQVTSLDKFLGTPNIQVAGQPVQGRSGGGLFSNEGYVIGVCNAADPSDKEGLFAALGLIYSELDRAQLAFVYKSPSDSLAGSPAAVSPIPSAVPAAVPGPMAGPTDLASLPTPPAAMPTSPVIPASATEPIAALPSHEQAALEEIRRRSKEGAEVVVIVRPRGNSEAKSEVILLDHASPEFVRQISADARRQDQTYPTSLELPKPRKILLEWTRTAATP